MVVWNKTNAGRDPFYRSQHELIAVFRAGDELHRNNVQQGRFGRNRSNVWTYPGCNTFGRGRMDALSTHPTVKPVALVADALLDCTSRNDLVLDQFMEARARPFSQRAEKGSDVAPPAQDRDVTPPMSYVAIRRWHAGDDEARCNPRRRRSHLPRKSPAPFNSLQAYRGERTPWLTGSDHQNMRVGYGRPPRATQFQPGKSGNPKGRPKGSRSVADILREIIGQKIKVTENGWHGSAHLRDGSNVPPALPMMRCVVIREL